MGTPDRQPAASQVLRRIREEIDARRAAGQRLPAPPKTAIAGPEYFGFNQPEVQLDSKRPADANLGPEAAEGDPLYQTCMDIATLRRVLRGKTLSA